MASATRSTCLLLATLLYAAKGDVFQEALLEGRLHQDLFGNRTELDKHNRPSVHSNQSTIVELGLSLISLLNLDTRNSILESEVWVRVVWYDYGMHWNEEMYGGINVLRVKSELIWTPNFVFENSVEPARNSFASNQFNVLIYPNGQVLWVPSRMVKTACSVNLLNFPFDEQECQWKFTAWAYDGHALKAQLYSNKKEVDMADFYEADEWRVLGTTGRIEKDQEPTFSVRLKRRSCYYFFTLLIPLLITWCLVLVSFWLPPDARGKITMTSFCSLYLIILIIDFYYIVPHNGRDVPRILIFTSTTLLFSILSLLLSLVSVCLTRDCKSPVPSCLAWLVSGPFGTILCLGPSTRGVSIGARLLSSNVELTVSRDQQESASEGKQQGENDWTLATTALNRIFFTVFCIAFMTLLLSCLLG